MGQKYIKKKRLEVNIGKTNMMVFSKGGGRDRQRKRIWSWKGEEIEEVRSFNYLGFRFMKK